MVLGQQFVHHASLRYDLVRPIKTVIEFPSMIDSEQSVDGGNDIGGGSWHVTGKGPGPIAGSVNEAGADSAASDDLNSNQSLIHI